MPKLRPTFANPGEAKRGGFCRGIDSFFFPKPKAGRPKKNSNSSGRPPAKASTALQPLTAVQKASAGHAKAATSSAELLASAAASSSAGIPLSLAETAAVAAAAEDAASPRPPKQTHTNWSKGEAFKRLKSAVQAWKDHTVPRRTQRSLTKDRQMRKSSRCLRVRPLRHRRTNRLWWPA